MVNGGKPHPLIDRSPLGNLAENGDSLTLLSSINGTRNNSLSLGTPIYPVFVLDLIHVGGLGISLPSFA